MGETKNEYRWDEHFVDLPSPQEVNLQDVPDGSIIKIEASDTEGFYFLARHEHGQLVGDAMDKSWQPGQRLVRNKKYGWTRPVDPESNTRVMVVSVPTDAEIKSGWDAMQQHYDEFDREVVEKEMANQRAQVQSIMEKAAPAPGSDYSI